MSKMNDIDTEYEGFGGSDSSRRDAFYAQVDAVDHDPSAQNNSYVVEFEDGRSVTSYGETAFDAYYECQRPRWVPRSEVVRVRPCE